MIETRDKQTRQILAARGMRNNSTPAEAALWNALRNHRLGRLKFYRQRVIGPFIADFYCAAAKLIIEIDKDVHDYQVDYDQNRTRYFEDRGYRVIRFSNEMVLNKLDQVLDEIKRVVLERISELSTRSRNVTLTENLTPDPSPIIRRGEQAYRTDLSPDSGSGKAPLPLESGEGVGG